MKQKIVIKVQMNCTKCKTKALQIAAVAVGVESVALAGEDKNQVVVIGVKVDAVSLTSSLRKKVGHAEIVSIAEVKPADKDFQQANQVTMGANRPKVHQLMRQRNSYRAGELIRHNSTTMSRSSSLSSSETAGDDDYRAFISELSMKKKDHQISEILITIDDYMQQTSTTQSSLCKFQKICRVPNNLKQLHKQDFDPKTVSIGPFHRQKGQHLHYMEAHKLRFFSCLFNCINPANGDKNQKHTSTAAAVLLESLVESLQQQQHQHQHQHQQQRDLDDEPIAPSAIKLRRLVVAMKELEAYARACYSETFDDLSSNEFVLMMLLDGCFIVQLLRLYAKCDREHVDDPIFSSSRWMVPKLQHDLILFENQLPFTVLKRIFKITSSGDDQYSLEDLTLKFFDSLLPREKNILSNCKVDSNPHHLLGLFRSSFLPAYKLDRKSSLLRTRRRQADDHHSYQQQFSSITINIDLVQERSFIRCATKLKEAGVVFKKRENEDLLDIEFKDGKLNIPYLFIDDHTGPVLLNFVAYEQCNQYSKPYFTQYLMFIEGLLKSSKDVEHLQSKGIIDHVLNCNEDVANLFNKLCKEVVRAADDCYLSEPLKDVNLYTQVKKHRRLAKLKEDYAEWKHDHFRSPWAFLSFLAAILLLVFTAIQTLFSVLAYISPRS